MLLWCIKRLLALRYDIRVKGLDRIARKELKKESGILFLPNHPAEIDPVILMAILMKTFKPRPLVVEHFYYMSGMHTFMRLVRAFPIPHVETTANQWKVNQVEKAFNTIKQGLKAGQNFLIYPSGSLKKEGYEAIGGNSFIHRLIHECPDVKIVLIRTTGLWGSCFSRALTGESPHFWKMAFGRIKVLLKNWVFFIPKRKVLVDFAINPEDFPRQGNRLEINKYLEAWYNAYSTAEGKIVKEEPLTLVSYERNREVYPEVTYQKVEKEKKSFFKKKIEVPAEIKEAVLEKIAELAEQSPGKIKEEQHLANDLGLDSLDAANIYAFLDTEYGVRDLKPDTIETVADVMYAAAEKIKIEEKEEKEIPSGWPKEEDRPRVESPDGKTVQEAFLRVCERMKEYSACADASSGVLTYKKLKLGAIVLSHKIKQYPGEYVGIMLPSSVGTYLTIFAVLLAGKIPVMLNWTAGVRTLNYAAELLDLKVILSSSKFLNRVESLDMGELEKLIVTLEDVKHSLTFKDKIRGVMLASKKPKGLLKKLNLEGVIRVDDPAVVLFTSGTENYPKAVPLSHKNLLENQKAALTCVSLSSEDIFYGVLPPFHSFGFSVTGLFPILTGLRGYYAPDPTNAKAMAKDAESWKVTVFCCAPSFFKNLFLVANPTQLKSVRLFVTGAEKAPAELFENIKALGPAHKIVEGYGITECSPLVTVCKENRSSKGVGQPLPNLELCLVHPETGELLPKGSQGELCIHGDSVFAGYLGTSVKNPFIEIKGKKWYRSGDLASIDEEGNVLLEGRLKRFIKIGGEMVSLNALEEELVEIAKRNHWTKGKQDPLLAIGVNETLERPTIVLFATFDVSKEQVNMGLRESGFGRIMKISDVKQLKEIPMTSTGKVHYRKLNEIASA
jgi:long-chain-fatty-acid--[acyl-carrier-protein] ligase